MRRGVYRREEATLCAEGVPLPKAGREAYTNSVYLSLRLVGRHIPGCTSLPKAGREAYTTVSLLSLRLVGRHIPLFLTFLLRLAGRHIPLFLLLPKAGREAYTTGSPPS